MIISSFLIPLNKIKVDHSLKTLSDKSGIRIDVKKPDFETHISFQASVIFPGGREMLVFENVFREIQKDWVNSDNIKEAIKNLHSGEKINTIPIEDFLIKSLYFLVEIERDDNVRIYISVHENSLEQHYCDYSKCTLQRKNDIVGWLS